jgi:hypothetical protein
VIPATPELIDEVIRIGIRKADRDEAFALGWVTEIAVRESCEASAPHVYAIMTNEGPVGLFGVGPTPSQIVGRPWLVGTDYLLSIKRDFIQQGPFWLHHLNTIYPVLENIVLEKNTTAVRWLKRLGFEFFETSEFRGSTFRRFMLCATA